MIPGLINFRGYSRKVSKIPGKSPHSKIPGNFAALNPLHKNILTVSSEMVIIFKLIKL